MPCIDNWYKLKINLKAETFNRNRKIQKKLNKVSVGMVSSRIFVFTISCIEWSTMIMLMLLKRTINSLVQNNLLRHNRSPETAFMAPNIR